MKNYEKIIKISTFFFIKIQRKDYMRKILFNDKYELTKAVLDGRKTMTRRLMKDGTPLGNFEETLKHSRYQIGEEIAIGQSYSDVYDEIKNHTELFSDRLFKKLIKEHKGAYNKMFVKANLMPHSIRITDINIERLQDISDEDCLKEGVFQWGDPFHEDRVEDFGFVGATKHYNTPREAFAALIDKVSGRGMWDSNPWVFVYTFELVK